MTAQQDHEKNLAWIDEAIEISREDDAETGRMYGWDNFESNGTKALRANRKVLERHGPMEGQAVYGGMTTNMVGVICADCRITYPCPTYTDITEGLDIK